MMNHDKLSFCKSLAGIRNKIVKSDGFLAGGSTVKFDVSDIDVTKTWRSMQGLADNETAKEALNLMLDPNDVTKVASILCMNASSGNDAVASKLKSHCVISMEAALLVVREARSANLDFQSVVETLRSKVFGIYSVRGIPFGPQMKSLVSMACLISARADCEAAINDELSDAEVLDGITMAHGASSPRELERAVDVLKTLDPNVRSNGTASSIKGHVTRIAHRYWFQRGICPEFMRETIARLIVKVANATAIPDEDYMHLEWLYRSAAIMCSMYFGCPDSEYGGKQTMDAYDLYSKFMKTVDLYSDAYVSLAFYERFGDDFAEVSAMFDEADVYVRAADKGVDADDGNSVITNQPVTRKVGSSTVHTGEKLASHGSLFDIVADAESKSSPFDELSK